MISILRQKVCVKMCLKSVGSHCERKLPLLGHLSGHQKLKLVSLFHSNETVCAIHTVSNKVFGWSCYRIGQSTTSLKLPFRCINSNESGHQDTDVDGIYIESHEKAKDQNKLSVECNKEIDTDEMNNSESTIDKEMFMISSENKEYASKLHDFENLPSIRNDDIDIANLRPALPPSAGSLSAYVNESETLTKLIHLGVDLSKMETDKDLANLILRMDFDKDVKPFLLFLHQVGVKDTDLGTVINRNPLLFKEFLDDLQVRVNYLESKRFSEEAIARIVTMTPKILSLPTVKIDFQLGFIQKEFGLTGSEVRTVLTSYPRIILCHKARLSENRIVYEDFLGFTKLELKKILLTLPKVVTLGKNTLMERFDYLHNTMGISHSAILAWPYIFKSRLFITKQRHQFLKLLRRDQFDPKKENFVTLEALVTKTDAEFCAQVAKVPVQQFNDFLKTL